MKYKEGLKSVVLALVATEGEIYCSVHAWTVSAHNNGYK